MWKIKLLSSHLNSSILLNIQTKKTDKCNWIYHCERKTKIKSSKNVSYIGQCNAIWWSVMKIKIPVKLDYSIIPQNAIVLSCILLPNNSMHFFAFPETQLSTFTFTYIVNISSFHSALLFIINSVIYLSPFLGPSSFLMSFEWTMGRCQKPPQGGRNWLKMSIKWSKMDLNYHF